MLNLNSQLYTQYGVDVNSISKISNKILNASSTKTQEPQVQSIDYSKFNRRNLGVDLYSSRTNVELQKQIALTQAGLYAQGINVAKLNSQAAMNLYSAVAVEKNVELAQSVQSNEKDNKVQAQEELQSPLKLFSTSDKNANSSNSFNPFRKDEDEKTIQAEQETSEGLNIFA